jgi:hypothetical protein
LGGAKEKKMRRETFPKFPKIKGRKRGGGIVAANFRIFSRRKGNSTDVNLSGILDGSSAFELLHFLKEKCEGCEKVVIHTRGIREIHPFGRETFQRNLRRLNAQNVKIEFTGENANEIAPER